MPLPVGTILSNRYRISKILYQSKLANVYTVEDIHLVGNIWAVKEMKVLAMNSTDRQKIIAHFQAEVVKMTELNHPNLARVIDFFVEGRNLYIIREFIPAFDIETLMAKSSGHLKERDVLAWGIQLADCLSYLYSKKFPAVFYRELTLGNILVNSEGMIKIIDLGLARLFQTETNPEKMQSMGSMHYAPPEQFDEYGSFDQRSLVYSCGAMLYHMLTARNPSGHLFNLPPIDQFNQEVSRTTRSIISKATANEPRMRHQSLSDLKRDLSRARKDPGSARRVAEVPPEPEEKAGGGTFGILATVAYILGLIVAGGLIFLIYRLFF